MEEKLYRVIAAGRKFGDPDNAGFARRLRKQRLHLFDILEDGGGRGDHQPC